MFGRLHFGTGALALAAALAIPVTSQASSQTDRTLYEEAARLTERIEQTSQDISRHAGRLTEMTRRLDSQRDSHSYHLDQIKFLVNDDLRPALTRLDQLAAALPEWKQKAAGRMKASAANLAVAVNAAYAAKAGEWRVSPSVIEAYRTWIARLDEHAGELLRTSDVASEYAEARLKAADESLVSLAG